MNLTADGNHYKTLNVSNCYLSLTATRSTDDESPCSASSDLPAIFVASIPCAKASSHGAWIFATGAVGATEQ